MALFDFNLRVPVRPEDIPEGKALRIKPTFDPTFFGLLPSKEDVLISPEAEEGLTPPERERLESSSGRNLANIVTVLGAIGTLFGKENFAPLLAGGLASGGEITRGKEELLKKAEARTAESRRTALQKAQFGQEQERINISRDNTALTAISGIAPFNPEAAIGIFNKTFGDRFGQITKDPKKVGLSLTDQVPPEIMNMLSSQFGIDPNAPITWEQLGKLEPLIKQKEITPTSLSKLYDERDSLIRKKKELTASGDTEGLKDINSKIDSFDAKIRLESQGPSAGEGRKIGATKEEILNKISTKGEESLTLGERQALARATGIEEKDIDFLITMASKSEDFAIAGPDQKLKILQGFVQILDALKSGQPLEELEKLKKPKGTKEGKGVIKSIEEFFLGKPKIEKESVESVRKLLPPAEKFDGQIHRDLKTNLAFKSINGKWVQVVKTPEGRWIEVPK